MKIRILQLIVLLAPILQTTGRGYAFTPPVIESGSPEEVVLLVYKLVSGPAGQQRDWDRYRSLYRPDARLITQDTSGRSYEMTVEDYIRNYGPLFADRGIAEEQIWQQQLRFGNLVHIWSTYQYHWLDDESDRGRGIASFQVLFEEGRWRIASLVWQMESDGNPLPKEYLPEAEARQWHKK